MRPAWPVRLRALLLACLFTGVGFGLPLVDGAVYHHSGRSFDVPHVEAAGASCHGERCLLDLAVASLGLAAPTPLPPRAVPLLLEAPRPPRPDPRPVSPVRLQPPPRAPPPA
ncbi:MAG TPA: hypothetical protein VFS40_15400 [Gemmatimonadales bacterium]|nr:hypothetical protein [Gemmatimonadales bacterium]